jgi:hypothetical protein
MNSILKFLTAGILITNVSSDLYSQAAKPSEKSTTGQIKIISPIPQTAKPAINKVQRKKKVSNPSNYSQPKSTPTISIQPNTADYSAPLSSDSIKADGKPKYTLGMAVENDYALFNAGANIGKNCWITGGAGSRGYATIEDVINHTGTKFDFEGKSTIDKNETIVALGLEKQFAMKKGLYWSAGINAYDNIIYNKETVEESIKNKSEAYLATNRDIYSDRKDNYSLKGKLGLGFNVRKLSMELYAKLGGNENLVGMNFMYTIRNKLKTKK